MSINSLNILLAVNFKGNLTQLVTAIKEFDALKEVVWVTNFQCKDEYNWIDIYTNSEYDPNSTNDDSLFSNYPYFVEIVPSDANSTDRQVSFVKLFVEELITQNYKVSLGAEPELVALIET